MKSLVRILLVLFWIMVSYLSYGGVDQKNEKELVRIVQHDNEAITIKNISHQSSIMVEIRAENGDFVGFTKMDTKVLKLQLSQIKAGEYTIIILGDKELQTYVFSKD